MHIEDVSSKTQLAHAGIGLTKGEALELSNALDLLLQDAAKRHEHVSSADYQTELTVWLQADDH